MSVLIKGMEMPKDCWHCYFADPESGECLVDQKPHGDWEEPDNCPLIPVPPHGRLIDADALDNTLGIDDRDDYVHWTLDAAPTIIPAEERPAEDTNAPTTYDLLYEEGGPDTR